MLGNSVEEMVSVLVDDGTGCVPCILWTNHASFTATTPAKGLELQARQELANGTAAKVCWNSELVC